MSMKLDRYLPVPFPLDRTHLSSSNVKEPIGNTIPIRCAWNEIPSEFELLAIVPYRGNLCLSNQCKEDTVRAAQGDFRFYVQKCFITKQVYETLKGVKE